MSMSELGMGATERPLSPGTPPPHWVVGGSITERLQRQRDELEIRLNLVTEALNALAVSPDVAKAVDALSKLGTF